MPTPGTETRNGVGGAAKQVAEHASSIARLELELAVLELKKKVVALGLGIGLGIGAALFALFALGFAFATVAAALATFLSTWLALLITAAGLFVLSGLLGLLALGRLRKASPPVPEQAIREARLTSAAIKR
jgi:Putative Actinobacterial Holin-X, holin superfamily III